MQINDFFFNIKKMTDISYIIQFLSHVYNKQRRIIYETIVIRYVDLRCENIFRFIIFLLNVFFLVVFFWLNK